MKRNILGLMVLTIVSSVMLSSVADVSAAPRVRVIHQGSIVKVIYDDLKPCNLSIAIYDNVGKKVFSETIRGLDDFIRPYNLTGLEEGTYWVKIKNGSDAYSEKIEYRLSSKNEEEILAHVTKVNSENLYLLSIPNMDGEKVAITILDEDNQVVYQETELIAQDFSKAYRIDGHNGNITFQIGGDNGKQVKTFLFSRGARKK